LFDISAGLREERRKNVDRAQNYDDIFALVKRIVEEELGEHRAGLSLVLARMSNDVGAYYPVGSNVIVINSSLISGLKRITKNPKEVNAFIFMVLMHEYLHSLGYLDENKVRSLAKMICMNSLGPDHPAVKLANANWLETYPQLGMMDQEVSKEFEVVQKFDSSSTGYIG
jgi:hypothetical protein